MNSEQRLDSIDARIERLVTLMEERDERLNQKLETLTEQVGRLTEGLTEIRLTTERQERNIDRLVGIVETLIQRDDLRK